MADHVPRPNVRRTIETSRAVIKSARDVIAVCKERIQQTQATCRTASRAIARSEHRRRLE